MKPLGLLIVIAICIGLAWGHWAERDGPDVLACEFYTQSKLEDPSSYARESVKRNDTAFLNAPRFKELAGKPASSTGIPELEQAWRIIDEGAARRGELQLRLLELNYTRWVGDALQTRVCAFRLNKGKLQSFDVLLKNAEGDLPKAAETLVVLRGGRRPPKPKYPCCL